MKDVKKKILRVTAVLADANATAKDKSTSFCPAFFYQPKRPTEKRSINLNMKKGKMRAFIAIVQLALNMMTTRLGKTFCIMLILTGGIVLCGISLLSMNIADYESVQLEQICDSSRTGFLYNDNAEEFLLDEDATYEERVEALTKKQPYEQFYNRLKESEIVELCGQVSELSNPEVDKNIPRIQAEHSMDTSDQMGCTFSYVQKDILALYDVDIEKKVDEADWMVGGIFLGWGFKEEYGNAELLDFKGEQRKILGFIKPNQKILVEDVAYPDGVCLSGLHDLDYTVMYLDEEDRYSTNTIHFRLAKGVSRDEFIKKVKEISKETDSEIIKLQLNKIAARWPAKAVAHFSFTKSK